MDVAPLYFVDAQGNRIAANLQQEYWNYLVKYKLFGNDFVKTGNRVIIHDESGWTGSNGYFKAEQPDGQGASVGTQLGGPIVVAGQITTGDGYKFTTGPIRGGSFQSGQNCNNCYYAAPICLDNTSVTGGGTAGFQAQPISNCPDQPSPNTAVSIPLLEWPASPTVADIKISANNGEQRIVVPDPVDGSKAPYDIYMDSILTGIGGTDGAKITVSMPAGGRVTRIFVHQIQLGNHTVIQIVYRTPQEDGSVVEVPAEKYVGNLLFYTDHDINIKNTDNSILLGTYVSTGRIYLQSNINFAGQLIANELVVGNEFDGRSFVFVPIDPPVLDLKPQADTPLEFPENDLLVKVPIALDTPAPADVFIDYCFDLQNSSAKESDFKLEDGYSYPKSKGHLFPICGQNMGKVTILKDAKTPADAPDVSVWINVAKDELVERPNETLRLKITNISGAVLPGNKLDGYFDLIIVDANVEPTSEDFEIIATEDEVFIFDSSMFKYESAFDKVEQGVVITSLPEKGFLLSNGDTLTSSDLDKFIPINETTNIDLQFIAAKDEYGVSPAYTSFTFKMKDADNVVSEKPYTVTVKVNPVNDKPIAHDTVYTINENVAAGTAAAGKIRMEDVDDTKFTYAFDTNDPKYTTVNSIFAIDATTGAITVKNAGLDYEALNADTTMVIKVIVTDAAITTSGSGKLADTSDVTIKVVDVNEAPVVRDTTFTVDENSPAGTEVGTLQAFDPDIRNPHFGTLSFTIVENTNSSNADDVPFSIAPDGTITVSVDDALDFETKPTWVINVKVTDGTYTETVKVTINLNDLNEPPVIEDPEDEYNVVENTANNVVFASIKITDQDAADDKDALTVTLTDLSTASSVAATQLFKATIVENDDHSLRIVISVNDSEKLDYEALLKNGASDVKYPVRLTITDHDGNGGQNEVSVETIIRVDDENEKPTAKDGNFTIAENSPAGTVVGTVEASDPDTANADFGTLYYSFVETTDQFVIDQATGEIRVKSGAVLDYETTPNHKITLHVDVTDKHYTETATVVVTLTDVNEPPIIIDDGLDYEVVENTAPGTEIARYEIKDVDAIDANFATSLVVFLTDNASHTVKAQDLFETVVKTEGGKTYAVLQVKSEPNFEDILNKNLDSLFNVTITLKDRQGADGSLSVTLPKKITVRDINEAPVILETPIYTVKENSAAGTSVGKVDAYDEDTWSALTFKLVNIQGEGDVASLFKIDNNGNITVAANANLDYETKNEYRVKVVVTDNGSSKGFTDLSDSVIITIQVTDEDEKPGFDDKYPTFSVYENSKAGTNVGTVTATDDDCKDNTCAALTYMLIADTVAANANDYKEFKIDPSTGKITVAKDSTLNYEEKKVYYALVVVYDGDPSDVNTLKDTARVTINIKDANDRPVIKNKTLTVPENSTAGTVVGKVPATDEDTWSKLAYSLADVNTTDQVAKLFTVDSNGVVKVAKDSTLDYEDRNEYQVLVVVKDNGSSRGFEDLYDTAVVTIKVSDVNEPPEFIDDGKPGYTVAENTAAGTEVARYQIKDPDAVDANFATSLKVSLVDNNTQNAILAQNLFNIKVETRNDSTFAVIRVASVPDFEAIKEANGDTLFNVTLTLKDQNGAAGCNEVTLEKKIYVSDVNEKPDVKDAEFAVDENSKKGDSVGVVEASDPDKFNPNFGTLYYSLLDSTVGAASLFDIDSTGKITVAENATLNYEETPVIYVKVRVTDNELSDTALVTVKLNDVDENPKIIIDDDDDGDDDTDSLCVAFCDTTSRGHTDDSTLTVFINENSADGAKVFAYVVSDEDAGDLANLTPSLKDNNGTGADSLFKAVMVVEGGKTKLAVIVPDGSKLDFEKVKPLHEVTVYVTDPDSLQDSIVRRIQVIDVNEAPTVEDAVFAVEENSKKGDSVGVVVASDPDVLNPAFGTLYYSLLDSTVGAASKFNIDNTGKITVAENAGLNYEQDSVFYVKVRVTDSTLSDTALVTIKLKDTDETPKIIVDDDDDGDDDTDTLCIAHCDTTNRGSGDEHGKNILTVGVNENSPTGTVVMEYFVYDEDADDVDSLVPSLGLIGTNVTTGVTVDDIFEINKVKDGDRWKIVVTVKDSDLLNYEELRAAQSSSDPEPQYTVAVIVSEPDGHKAELKDTIIRVIEIRDMNESPLFTVETCEIAENNQIGDSLGRVEHPSDIDSMSRIVDYYDNRFKLVGGDTALFDLRYDEPIDGRPNITLVAKVVFDCESEPYKDKCGLDSAFHVVIDYFDKNDTTIKMTRDVPIKLIDVNEKPKITTDSVDVKENVEKGTVVDTIKATDPDVYDTVLTYTLVEDKSGCFEVSERGVITVKVDNCPALDYEKNHELPITVKVTDNGTDGEGDNTLSDTKTIIVKITDVNEKPDIPDQTITVSEDAKIGTEVGEIEATDPDTSKAYGTLTYELVEESETFEVKEDGTIILKDSLDYEKDSIYTIKVRVTDGELSDTATVTIKIGNVIETPEVEITIAETVDSTWKSPDTLYINTTDLCVEWEARNKKSGATLKDTTECMLLEEGENIIVKKFEDPSMDFPGYDTLVVYVSKATPVVSIRKAEDDASVPNIFTVVEESAQADTAFYVNERKNEIIVTVTDPESGSKESFTTKIELDTVSVPKKTFTGTMSEITDFSLALTDNPSSGTSRTPVNGEKVAVSYTEVVNGHTVTVTYYTDDKGEMIANADGVVEMTVAYKDTIGGHEVTISYQADAVTGAVIKTSGGYAKPEDSAIESSSSGKDGSSSSGKDDKSSSSKGGDKKFENEVVYTVSYETVDEAGNAMTVSYGVDAEGNIVRNEDGNIGYLLTYTYKNKFGNTGTQSLFIVLDQVPPKVKILYPTEGEVIYSNFVDVKWTVDIGDGKGPIVQDTLITQSLNKGGNVIVRFYRDKAGNEASDTIRVIMKNAKDVDIAIEKPVTEVTQDLVAEYYATHEPEDNQTFAVTIYNPKTDKEVETVIGGGFDNKPGTGDEPYPGLTGHLGPTLGIETKVPTVNAVGGLATLDDIIGKDGLVPLEGVEANSSKKVSVEEYVRDYCTDEFAENVGSDLSRVNLYKTKMYVKIWIYTTLGDFVDYYTFTQELDDPDYMSDAGLLTLYFEMKPDRDGNVRTASGRLLGTGAYVYRTEVEMKSTLRCSVPPFTQNAKGGWEPEKPSNKVGSARSVKEDMLKNFGYKRPEKK
ncbi:Cadherin domain-containing protein [Fibrobacter sp. UWT3]|nr:Cadherin domain-containing protein [Fibrobacter sp. UWT3]